MQVVGRDIELARVDKWLDASRSGPARILLEGEAGIGKTTLWRSAVDAAARRGFRALIARPSEGDSSLAYAGLADLLTNVEREFFAALPEPQRQALDVALLEAAPKGRPPDPRAIYTAFRSILGRLAEQAPVLLAVDDLQWLDVPSARALEFVDRRMTEIRVAVLLSARPTGPPEPNTGAWVGEDERLRLKPLSAQAMHRLIKQRLGASLARPMLLRLHRACGGNAFYALEIARLLTESGSVDARDAWPVPDDVRALTELELRELPLSVREALLRAAAASQPTADLFGEEALRAARDAELITVGAGGRVRFAHPLYASALYTSATPEQRRRVHIELAQREPNVEERARHLALATAHEDPAVASVLDMAATHAHTRGAPETAAELQERALELTPAADAAGRSARALAAAGHWYRAGSFLRARQLLDSLVGDEVDRDVRARALRLVAQARFHEESVREATALLHRAAEVAGEDPVLRAPVELDLAYASVSGSFDFERAGPHAAAALTYARRLDDRALLAQALAVKSIAGFLLGSGTDENMVAEALALERPDDDCPIELRPTLIGGHLALYNARFAEARSLLYPLCARLRERGEEAALPTPLTAIVWLECWAGDLQAARRAAEEAVAMAELSGSDAVRGAALAHLAFVDAHAGREDQCREWAGSALGEMHRTGYGVHAIWSLNALALLELSLGNASAAAKSVEPLLGFFERVPPAEPIRAFFLPDAIEALIGVGELERAERLTEYLGERGRALRRPWALATSARCNALLQAAHGRLPTARRSIDEALQHHQELSMPLERARALLAKGQLERRSKHWASARQALEDADAICEEIGAALWGGRARRELVRLGSRHRPGVLTATEERVAALVASGLTNREVAAASFMSQKTVEANLSRIYRKLGIRSRAELGVRLMNREAHTATAPSDEQSPK
jgi:DNA-binding CsgD family transcriptional regulator